MINKAKIQERLIKAFHERYFELRLILNTPDSLPFELVSLNHPLFYETGLNHMNNQIIKIMKRELRENHTIKNI